MLLYDLYATFGHVVKYSFTKACDKILW